MQSGRVDARADDRSIGPAFATRLQPRRRHPARDGAFRRARLYRLHHRALTGNRSIARLLQQLDLAGVLDHAQLLHRPPHIVDRRRVPVAQSGGGELEHRLRLVGVGQAPDARIEPPVAGNQRIQYARQFRHRLHFVNPGTLRSAGSRGIQLYAGVLLLAQDCAWAETGSRNISAERISPRRATASSRAPQLSAAPPRAHSTRSDSRSPHPAGTASGPVALPRRQTAPPCRRGVGRPAPPGARDRPTQAASRGLSTQGPSKRLQAATHIPDLKNFIPLLSSLAQRGAKP